jgi:hypothetical protein
MPDSYRYNLVNYSEDLCSFSTFLPSDLYLLKLTKSLQFSIKKGISWMKLSFWIKMMTKNRMKIK